MKLQKLAFIMLFLRKFLKHVLFQDEKIRVRKMETWDPGNKDIRQEEDEGNKEDNVEFRCHDAGGLESSQFTS